MSETVRVVVDAMGGDNAPGEIVKGAVEAVQAENKTFETWYAEEPKKLKTIAEKYLLN
mgnify:CR=1 FL=1